MGLRNHAGVRGLLKLAAQAAAGVYHPGHGAEEKMKSLLFLRLGGARLAGIAHRALGLPSLSTIRHNTVICPLCPSPGKPTLSEIEYNINACFDATPDDPLETPHIVHVVLMLDEIALEKRLRWDDKTNMILGIC